MVPHDGKDPHRDREKEANAWFQTRVLLMVIAILAGLVVATLLR